MNETKLPANIVTEFNLTPDLRRKIAGSSVIANFNTGGGETKIDTSLYDVICKVLVFTNINISSVITEYDGVTLNAGDLILVNGQYSSPENGIYVVSDTELSRLQINLATGKPVFISHGTYKSTGWVLVTESFTIDSTGLNFVKVFPFDELTNDARLGYLNLYAWDLFNAYILLNNVRFDKPETNVHDYENIFSGSKTEIYMIYDNEVIHGERIKEINKTGCNNQNKYSAFVCGIPGTYDTYFYYEALLTIEGLPDDLLVDELTTLACELWVKRQSDDPNDYPNGRLYSRLGAVANKQYYYTAPDYDIVVANFNLKFIMQGYDVITLESGDYIYLKVTGSGFYNAFGQYASINLLSAENIGRWSIEYRNYKSEIINDPINT